MRYLLGLLLFVSQAFADEAAVKALNPTAWWKSYKGLTAASTRVISQVADQSGNSRVLAQAGADSIKPVVTRADNRENVWTYSSTPASWTVVRGAMGATTTAPDGSSTASPLVATAVDNSHYAAPTAYPWPAGETRVLSFWVKNTYAAEPWVYGMFNPGAAKYCYVNSSNGTVGTATSGVVCTTTAGADGWYQVVMSFYSAAGSATAYTPRIGQADGDNDDQMTGDGTSGNTFWGAQDRSSLADPAYQATTTAPEYRGVCNTAGNHCLPAIHFDGVDDYLEGSANYNALFTTTNKHVFALARNLTTGRADILAGDGGSSVFWFGFGTSSKGWIGNYSGSSVFASSVDSFSVNELTLINGYHSAGATLGARINGGTFGTNASGTTTGTMAYKPWIARVGTTYYNLDLVELITFNTALSAANQAVVEAYLTGVMSASADPWKRVSVLP